MSGLTAAEHAALRGAADAIADGAAALEACRNRGIAVERWHGDDDSDNSWCAAVPYRSRTDGRRGVVHILGTTEVEAARMALRYVGARGWQQ